MNCWQKGLFEKCFDIAFQRSAVQLVTNDTEGKYFGKHNTDPVVTNLSKTVEGQVLQEITDEFENEGDHTLEADMERSNQEFVGHKVVPLNGKFPGYVQPGQ